jgi:hypothetical protein
MARFNEILVGRYNRFIQKLLSMKGDASLFQFSTEMMAVLPFFSGSENRYLEGWNRFGNQISVAANGALNSAVRLRNPSGSNLLVVIEEVIVFNLNAAALQYQMQHGVQAADLTTIQAPVSGRLDARGNANPSTVNSVGNGTPGYGSALNGFVLLPNTTIVLPNNENQELPILPGDAYDVFTAVVNVTLNVGLIWRERLLEESERT